MHALVFTLLVALALSTTAIASETKTLAQPNAKAWPLAFSMSLVNTLLAGDARALKCLAAELTLTIATPA